MTTVWQFDETQVKEFEYEQIPAGEHRIRIEDVVPGQSKEKGTEYWKITFAVSGYSSKLFFYLNFLPNNPEITNTNLSNIYDSFGLNKGDMNLQNWLGKVGACMVKEEPYNGKTTSKVNYFIKKENQSSLPAWQEKGSSKPSSVKDYMKKNSDDTIPF